MGRPARFSPEVREGAVRMVFEHRGRNGVDRNQDWLYGRNAAEMGPAGRAGHRTASGSDDVEFATRDRVAWFNDWRLLGPIGNIPPVEFEQMYYQQQQSGLVEAGLNYNGLRDSRAGSDCHT